MSTMQGRLFDNRWWIVVGATLGLMMTLASVSLYTIGLFFKPLGDEFGWTRGQISTAAGILPLCTAVSTPLVGYLMDKWGVKRVLVPAILLFAASTAALGLTSGSILVFTILMAIAGFGGSGQSPSGYVKILSAWFDRRRGLVLGIATCGTGIGVIIVPQVAQFFIDHYGWRSAYFALALMMLIITLPSIIFLLRDPTEAPVAKDAVVPDQTTSSDLPGVEMRGALTDYRFWFLAVSIVLVALVIGGVVVHTVPMLTDHGYTATAAAGLMAAYGVSQIAGRVLCGTFMDYVYAPLIAAAIYLLAAAGMYFLGTATLPILGIIALGICSGTEIDVMAYLSSRYFGLKRLGLIFGVMFTAFSIGIGVGPILLGSVFERTQSYTPALIGFSLCLAVAAVLMLCLGPYRYPALSRHRAAPESNVESVSARTS